MALSTNRFSIAEDPWKVSAFVSAIVELFLSILLLLGAAIAFFTSQTVKFFGLEPPCTYIGCSHLLHLHSEGNPKSHTPGFKDHAKMGTCVDGCNTHLGCEKKYQRSCDERSPFERQNPSKLMRSQDDRYEIVQVSAGSEEKGKCEATVMKDTDDQCACSGSLFHKRRGRSKRPRRRDFAYAHYNGKLNQTYSTSQSVRSNFESNGGLIANDHGELIAGKRNVEKQT
ncbi:hypothetical protein L7F22_018627 [Adiantum nelumboides]|nr:hypothetical protein [Adiantum nelumboides]